VTGRRTTPSRRQRRAFLAKTFCGLCGSALIVVAGACGQKGAPLPPIIRTPAAPGINANRRGSEIELQLSVPSANTDGSRPANLTRIDIYAVNGAPSTMTDAEMVKRGTKVASVAVKAARDPNDTVEKDEPAENAEPTVGEGLEQGASSAIEETVTASLLESHASDRPFLGPPGLTELRTYIGVGVDRRGRLGQFSKRVSVPLQLPPAPPPPIAITYDEHTIVITWKPVEVGASDERVLPSRSFGPLFPEVSYNLYDAATAARLNDKPILENGYEDKRMTWGTNRCYLVRAVEFVAKLPIESEPTGPTCQMLVDTFPPAPPKGLTAVATEGAINLIWDPNAEADLAGYVVLRAIGDEPLQRITSEPIADASFFDNVQRGLRFTYAVQAVDKAGNVSQPSSRVEETAR
jgi:hypothetical protein